ncbi:MAG: Acetylornithine deacetylase, partial [uncultured Thermomicrobiales bacterium]
KGVRLARGRDARRCRPRLATRPRGRRDRGDGPGPKRGRRPGAPSRGRHQAPAPGDGFDPCLHHLRRPRAVDLPRPLYRRLRAADHPRRNHSRRGGRVPGNGGGGGGGRHDSGRRHPHDPRPPTVLDPTRPPVRRVGPRPGGTRSRRRPAVGLRLRLDGLGAPGRGRHPDRRVWSVRGRRPRRRRVGRSAEPGADPGRAAGRGRGRLRV